MSSLAGVTGSRRVWTTCRCLISASLLALVPAVTASGAPDEIQVYLDDVHGLGESGLELHVNYALSARKTPDYPGEKAPYRILRVTPEFSFGLGHHWDWGLYLPLSHDANTGSSFLDGFKLRVKHLNALEHEGGSEFYGVNLEVGHAPARAAPSDWHGELRGIIGARRGPWLVALNPVLEAPLSSSVSGSTVDFAVNLKASREVRHGLALGIEHYAELGPVRHPTFGSESGQTTYLTVDLERKGWDVNIGLGHGWNEADKRVAKLIVGLPF